MSSNSGRFFWKLLYKVLASRADLAFLAPTATMIESGILGPPPARRSVRITEFRVNPLNVFSGESNTRAFTSCPCFRPATTGQLQSFTAHWEARTALCPAATTVKNSMFNSPPLFFFRRNRLQASMSSPIAAMAFRLNFSRSRVMSLPFTRRLSPCPRRSGTMTECPID